MERSADTADCALQGYSRDKGSTSRTVNCGTHGAVGNTETDDDNETLAVFTRHAYGSGR